MDATRQSSGTLDDVLTVESELAERIGSERRNAARWLTERKCEIDEASRSELAEIQRVAKENEEAAKKAAAANAAAIVERSIALAARLQALDDAQLGSIVRKHLAAILPGAAP
jgi:uncharacterized protein YpuA (DUF1002 family)